MTLAELTQQPHQPVEARLAETVRDLWLDRVRAHLEDSYVGVRMTKFPEDLRVYEHLLWATAPDVVIEVGVQHGGSALWFRDRLRTLEHYDRTRATRVVGIDVDVAAASRNLSAADPEWQRSITLIEGDIREREVVERIAAALPADASCFVVEDSAHEYDTTLAALTALASFVPPGGFFVVEDGCVDIDAMRLEARWPRGVLPAVADWLRSPGGTEFVRRRDLELYGLTCHPGGFLQRRPPVS